MTARRKRAPAKRQAPAKAKKPAAKKSTAAQPTGLSSEQRHRRNAAEILRDTFVAIVATYDPPMSKSFTPGNEESLGVRRPLFRPEIPDELETGGYSHTVLTSRASEEWHAAAGFPIAADSAYWAGEVLTLAGDIIIDAVAELYEIGDLSGRSGSALSIIGDAVSAAARRRVLQLDLIRTDYNLTHTAARLRMGYGTGNVLRAIKELGLEDDYRQHAKRGRKPRKALGAVAGESAPENRDKK